MEDSRFLHACFSATMKRHSLCFESDGSLMAVISNDETSPGAPYQVAFSIPWGLTYVRGEIRVHRLVLLRVETNGCIRVDGWCDELSVFPVVILVAETFDRRDLTQPWPLWPVGTAAAEDGPSQSHWKHFLEKVKKRHGQWQPERLRSENTNSNMASSCRLKTSEVVLGAQPLTYPKLPILDVVHRAKTHTLSVAMPSCPDARSSYYLRNVYNQQMKISFIK